jgi:hypothetical protein
LGLDEIVLDGARRMLAAALEAEVDAYITALSGERDEQVHRLGRDPRCLPDNTRPALLGAQGRERIERVPKSVQPTARRMLAEIRDAEGREHAESAIESFAAEFKAKWPAAVAKIVVIDRLRHTADSGARPV